MKTLRSLVKVIHTNFFDEEPWDAYHYSKIGITDTRMLEVIPLEDGAGAVMKIGLNSGDNYIFQLDIIRDNIPSTSALMFAIRDDNMNILVSQEVNENGFVYQQFTAPFSGTYFVTVTQNTVVNPASFYLDNYYVYALPASGQDFVSLYLPDVLAYNDYYPFGMQVPRRFDSLEDYRYGFQGQEKDDEIKGEGNSYDFGARLYDPRVGRWFAIDPLENEFPYVSPYAYALNNPIYIVDLDGKKPDPIIVKYIQTALNNMPKIKANKEFQELRLEVYGESKSVVRIAATLNNPEYLYKRSGSIIKNKKREAKTTLSFYGLNINVFYSLSPKDDLNKYNITDFSWRGDKNGPYLYGVGGDQSIGYFLEVNNSVLSGSLPILTLQFADFESMEKARLQYQKEYQKELNKLLNTDPLVKEYKELDDLYYKVLALYDKTNIDPKNKDLKNQYEKTLVEYEKKRKDYETKRDKINAIEKKRKKK